MHAGGRGNRLWFLLLSGDALLCAELSGSHDTADQDLLADEREHRSDSSPEGHAQPVALGSGHRYGGGSAAAPATLDRGRRHDREGKRRVSRTAIHSGGAGRGGRRGGGGAGGAGGAGGGGGA